MKRSFKQFLSVPAEIALQAAMIEIEKLGASPELTRAITHLSEAKDLVSKHVDKAIKESEES